MTQVSKTKNNNNWKILSKLREKMVKSKNIKDGMLLQMSYRKRRIMRELRSQINSPFYKRKF